MPESSIIKGFSLPRAKGTSHKQEAILQNSFTAIKASAAASGQWYFGVILKTQEYDQVTALRGFVYSLRLLRSIGTKCNRQPEIPGNRI
jgi:hypothetical protein